MTEPSALDDMIITEFSLVDVPADKRALPVMAKRDELSPKQAYESLWEQAGLLVNQFSKREDTKLTQPQVFEKLLLSRDPKIPIDADEAYHVMMAKAAELHISDPSRTEAQHFAALYEKRVIPQRESDTDDGDDPSGADDPDPAGDMDDDDAGVELGPPRGPRGGAGIKNRGQSKGVYETSGVNVMTIARPASTGSVEMSYNDRARPSSASPPAATDGKSRTFVGGDPRTSTSKSKFSKRVDRLIAEGMPVMKAIHWASAPKRKRQQMKLKQVAS